MKCIYILFIGLYTIYRYDAFNELKDENPNLKTLLATGGWNAGSVPFSQMVTDVNLREKFARTSVEFVRDFGFDGLDMDWEYPAMRGGLPEDKDNFIELLKVCFSRLRKL